MRALVLSGGGARGAWQMGAIEALVNQGVHWDFIVGTSVGAINATAFSLHGVEGAKSLWFKIKDRSSVMQFNWDWPWSWSGWYSFDPLKRTIEENLASADFIVPVYAVMTDLVLGGLVYQKLKASTKEEKQDSAEVLIETSSLPGIHKLTKSSRLDGGLLDIAAVDLAYELGATSCDVILCDQPGTKPGWAPSGIKPLSVMLRSLQCMLGETLREDIENAHNGCTVYIPGDELKTDSLTYDPIAIRSDMSNGYLAVTKRKAQK